MTPNPLYITAAPQAIDNRQAGYAVVLSALMVAGQGQITSDRYTFGAHAAVIHTAEAEKTKFFPPAISGVKPAVPPTFAYARGQDDPNQVRTQQFIWAASAASYTLLGNFVKGIPQADPTQPPTVIQPSLAGEGLPANPAVRFIQAAPQVDLTPPSFVRSAIPNPPILTGRLTARILVVPPQADPSQMQPQYWQPFTVAPGNAIIGDIYQMGTHSGALYNAEAVKIDYWQPLNAPLVQPTPITSSEYTFGTHAANLYNAEAAKTQIFPPAASTPILPGACPGSEYLFGTHAKALYDYEAAKTLFFWRVSPNQQGAIIPFPDAEPQDWNYNLPPQFFKPALTQPPNSLTLSTVVAKPQQVDLTIQPVIHGPTFTTPPPAFISPKLYTAGPQPVDLSIQPVIRRTPPVAPPTTINRSTLFAAPQFVDLTIQPAITKQAYAVPLPPFAPLRLSFTAEQSYDLAGYEPHYFTIGKIPFVPTQLITVLNWGGRVVLSPKKVGEDTYVPVDFISRLGIGETLISANVVSSVYTGTDPNAGDLVNGPALINGTVVEQLIDGGIVGVVYELLYTVGTSAGQTLQLAGYFAVIPDLP
jgi:hypothetical protein